MKKAKKYTVSFLEKKKLNKETYEFRFSKPRQLKFKPGQYLKMYLDIPRPDNRGTSRYLTISASPLAPFLSVTTRVIKSSFKKKLAKLKKGDEVSIFAPLGYFDVDLKDEKLKIFLSGGIGVTPYHSILTTVRSKRLKSNVFYFASFEKEKDILYKEELNDIQSQNNHIKVIYTLTRENNPSYENGRINLFMISKYVRNWKSAKIFVVGSEKFEEGLIDSLKEDGVKEENIFSENFPGY